MKLLECNQKTIKDLNVRKVGRYHDAPLPAQVSPFPLKPCLQAHVKLPFVSIQEASESQLSVPWAHSSISMYIRNKD